MDNNKLSLKLRFTKWIKTDDHIEYQIKIISTKDESLNADFNQRYSTLRDFHDALRKEANTNKFPKFPPKKYFGNTDEKFLNQRMAALDHYFNQVFEDFSHLSLLKKWIEEKLAKYSKKVVKEPIKDETSTQNKSKVIEPSESKKINKPEENKQDKNNKAKGTIILIFLEEARYKEILDTFTKKLIDPDNNGLNDKLVYEELENRYKSYSNAINKKGVNDPTNSIFFNKIASDNGNFDCMGLDEPKVLQYQKYMTTKLSEYARIIKSTLPENYDVDDLILSVK